MMLCSKTLLFLIALAPFVARAQSDTIFKVFQLKQVENGVLIDFTMFSGATCNGIRVERSTDGTLFETLHEFVGVCGSSSGESYYSYTDADPIVNRASYYRLDAGLQGLYSDTRSIKYIDYGISGITQFPNPCSNDCSWYFENPNSEAYTCTIIDAQGKTIIMDIVKGSVWKPETNSVPQGLYGYSIRKNYQLVGSGKILINKP
jgi:hypothetical protein